MLLKSPSSPSRYVSVLVELSQLEGGGGRHGAILAQQMMDVAIRFGSIVHSQDILFRFSIPPLFRVAAIRPFATQQMALLVENSAVIMAKGRRNSSAEVRKLEMFLFHFIWLKVLYAAGWLVGEFCEHLTSPVETLKAMLRALSSSLPHHIQV